MMKCSDNRNQLKELMVRPSKEILGSHDFKTNVLYVNAGFIEAGQLSSVVTKEEKGKTQVFQEIEEGSYNLMMKREEKLLNVATEDFVGDHQFLKDVSLEDNQGKEGWLTINVEEESVELLEEIPNELADLWYELSLLEDRLAKQKLNIQIVKLELSKDEEIVINDKSGKEAVKKSKFLSKHSEGFVSQDLCNCDTNQCVDSWKSEETEKQKIGYEDQVEMERYEALISHKEELMLCLQYDEHEIVLEGNKKIEIMECKLKSEMLSEIEGGNRMKTECYNWHDETKCGSYHREVKLLKYLLEELKYGSEFEVQGQQVNVTEGDVLRDIKDEGMVETSSQQLKSESVKWDKKLDEFWIVMRRS
jgi:hypothetical protein